MWGGVGKLWKPTTEPSHACCHPLPRQGLVDVVAAVAVARGAGILARTVYSNVLNEPTGNLKFAIRRIDNDAMPVSSAQSPNSASR